MTHLQTTLRDRYGIGAERVTLQEPSTDVAEGSPAVKFDIGAVGAHGAR